MYCHICGKEIDEESAFCCYCGTKIPTLDKKDAFYNTIKEHLKNLNQATEGTCDSRKVKLEKHFKSSKDRKRYTTRILLIIIAIIICHFYSKQEKNDNENAVKIESNNEEERWDSESYIYANFKNGVAFNLTRGLHWEKISGTAKHTIVKFLQPETGLTMFANIYPIEIDIKGHDIWDVYNEFIKPYKEKVLFQYCKDNLGMNITNVKNEKAIICGKHAIKLKYDFTFDDDRFSEKTKYTTIEYIFIHNQATFCVAASCPIESLDLFTEEGVSLEFFLSSFHLTPTNT